MTAPHNRCRWFLEGDATVKVTDARRDDTAPMTSACTEECCAYAPPGWEREYEREAADQYAEQAGLNRPRAERVEAAAEYRRLLLAAAQALEPTTTTTTEEP